MKHIIWSILPTLLLAVSSCTTRGPYREVRESSVSAHLDHVQDLAYQGKLRDLGPQAKNSYPGRDKECLEKYSGDKFWVGHVEFTDYGSFQDHKQLNVLERAVEADLKSGKSLFRNGILLLVYVHGWQNNAKDGNGNLEEFRKLLQQTAAKETNRGVLGVYVSWRGESWRVPGIKHAVTYWGRKRVAHDFGHGNLVETLARLKNLEWLVARGGGMRSTPDQQVFERCRMVCVGHSFGAAALYSAVAQPIEAGFQVPYWEKRRYGTGQTTMEQVTGMGDLVILINPAFEALPYRALHHAVSTNTNVQYHPDQSVLMLVLSSRNDKANKSYLPFGQWLGHRLMDMVPHSNQRRESWQRVTALGHYGDYHSHLLDLESDTEHLILRPNPAYFAYGHQHADGEPLKVAKPVVTLKKQYALDKFCTADNQRQLHAVGLNANDLARLPDSKNGRPKLPLDKLPQAPALLPFMVVSVAPSIINGHGGFWPGESEKTAAYDFVRTFIAAQSVAVAGQRHEEAKEEQAKHSLKR
jgi:hypothetical protein